MEGVCCNLKEATTRQGEPEKTSRCDPSYCRLNSPFRQNNFTRGSGRRFHSGRRIFSMSIRREKNRVLQFPSSADYGSYDRGFCNGITPGLSAMWLVVHQASSVAVVMLLSLQCFSFSRLLSCDSDTYTIWRRLSFCFRLNRCFRFWACFRH
jgi:hypothetical protein